jgi:hypothetical protein
MFSSQRRPKNQFPNKGILIAKIFHTYSLSCAGFFTLQSLALLLSPKLIASLLVPEARQITDLESYLSRSLGLSVLTLAIFHLIFTGVIPGTSSSSSSSTVADEDATTIGPYAYPTVIVTTLYTALQAFYLYTQTTSAAGGNASFAFVAGLVANAGLFAAGVFIILFAGEKGRVSKRTGADKRTSNWPFTNKRSAREIKKASRAGL